MERASPLSLPRGERLGRALRKLVASVTLATLVAPLAAGAQAAPPSPAAPADAGSPASPAAPAAPPSPAARAALAEANAYAQAGLWEDARAAADRAVFEAPTWAAARAARAEAKLRGSLPAPVEELAESPPEDLDVPRALEALRAADADLAAALQVETGPAKEPTARRREQVQAAIAKLDGVQQAAAAAQAEEEARRAAEAEAQRAAAKAEAQARADEAKREADARAAALVAEQARAEADRQAREAAALRSVHHWRAAGWWLVGLGVASGAAGGVAYYQGAAAQKRIEDGGLATSNAILDEHDRARSMKALGVPLLAAGAAGLLLGTTFIASHRLPATRVSLRLEPRGVVLAAEFP